MLIIFFCQLGIESSQMESKSDTIACRYKSRLIPQGSLFVCVEVLRPSQPNGVLSSVVSLPSHTFTGQA